ncbi:MAG: MazG-like family protein [Minisyncoccia bacterium]|jgi:NTP pyrophosphatase (non-canonical NTP hydrolase)
MADFKQLQKIIYKNKVKHGFNVTDVDREFNFIYAELAEAFHAFRKKSPELGEEIADVVIYLLGLAEILKIDLGKEIVKKMDKNKKRVYEKINGVTTRVKG